MTARLPALRSPPTLESPFVQRRLCRVKGRSSPVPPSGGHTNRRGAGAHQAARRSHPHRATADGSGPTRYLAFQASARLPKARETPYDSTPNKNRNRPRR